MEIERFVKWVKYRAVTQLVLYTSMKRFVLHKSSEMLCRYRSIQ